MSTITVWILFVMGTGTYSSGSMLMGPKFATLPECQRVAEAVIRLQRGMYGIHAQCIQATIVREQA